MAKKTFKDEGWWGWSSMWAFCAFYPFYPWLLGSEERWYPFSPFFLSNYTGEEKHKKITRGKKNIRNREERTTPLPKWEAKLGDILPAKQSWTDIWNGSAMTQVKSYPPLVKTSHGLSTNFAIFTKLYGREISEKWRSCTISRQRLRPARKTHATKLPHANCPYMHVKCVP